MKIHKDLDLGTEVNIYTVTVLSLTSKSAVIISPFPPMSVRPLESVGEVIV